MKDLLAQAVVHKGSFKPFLKSWKQNPRYGTTSLWILFPAIARPDLDTNVNFSVGN